jgi:hypothetical protein
MAAVRPPLPDLVLYGRAGCVLCDEARAAIGLLLADRAARGQAVPRLVEHDIDADPALHDRWFERIPVVELGTARLELATSMARLRCLLAGQLDEAVPA